MSWFSLALLAPLLFAIINLIDDHMLKHVYRSPHSGAIVSSLFAGIPLFSLFFFDLKQIASTLVVLAVIAGFMLSIMYYNYFRSFEEEPPSIIVAVLGISPVILAITGYLFLDEKLSIEQIAGSLIVVVASILLVFRKGEKFKRSKASKHLITALFAISIYSFLSKYLFERADFYTVYIYITLGIVFGGIFFMFYLLYADKKYVLRDLRKSFRKYFFVFLFTELLAILAEFTSALAVSRGPVSVVRSIENIQPIYVLLIAIILYPFWPNFFREAEEGNILKKLLLMGFILLGLYLIGETALG